MTDPAPVDSYRVPFDSVTLAEALAGAIAFEASARRFYCDLATRVCRKNRELVEELAAEALSHLKLLEEMVEDPDLAEHLQAWVEPPATLSDFGAYVTLPLDQDHLRVDELLSSVEAPEQIAREHYGYLTELASEGPVRDLFRFLREE
jgi:rubrerythrin